MVQVSKNKLPKDILNKLFNLFFETLGKKYDKNEFQEIINDLFSETEQVMLIKRIAIIYLLLKNIDYTTISSSLKVSAGTISKFSLLVNQDRGIVKFLKEKLFKEKIGDFFDDIFYELFARPGKYGTNWKVGWQYKFERDRKKQTGL